MKVLSLERLPEPRQVAIAVGAAIALLGVLGAVDLLAPSLPMSLLSLEGERRVPAAFSAGLLLGAGALAWMLSTVSGSRGLGSPGLWRFMGAFLVFMALDELFAIHEHVSAAETGITWQVFYAPISVSAVIAWAVILRRLPSGLARGLWLGGAAAWFVSQVIEAVQWDGTRLVYEWTFVPEEMLEMTGSLLWGLALLVTLRTARVFEGDERGEIATDNEAVTTGIRLRQSRRRRRVRGQERAGERSGTQAGRTPDAR
jgi:hypothetical protein